MDACASVSASIGAADLSTVRTDYACRADVVEHDPGLPPVRRTRPLIGLRALAGCGVRLALPRGKIEPGLPMILGGAAISMLDLASLYV